MIARQRQRQDTKLGWQWLVFGILLAIFMASLMIFAIRVMAQQPPPQGTNSQKMSSEERAMLIVRARELELTRLVASYANRVEDLMEENQHLKQQLANPLPCPAAPTTAPTEEPKSP